MYVTIRFRFSSQEPSAKKGLREGWVGEGGRRPEGGPPPCRHRTANDRSTTRLREYYLAGSYAFRSARRAASSFPRGARTQHAAHTWASLGHGDALKPGHDTHTHAQIHDSAAADEPQVEKTQATLVDRLDSLMQFRESGERSMTGCLSMCNVGRK